MIFWLAILLIFFNPFVPSVLFLYPLKTFLERNTDYHDFYRSLLDSLKVCPHKWIVLSINQFLKCFWEIRKDTNRSVVTFVSYHLWKLVLYQDTLGYQGNFHFLHSHWKFSWAHESIYDALRNLLPFLPFKKTWKRPMEEFYF